MLEAAELTFRIGDAHILNGIGFRVSPGEKVGIIGPNGSGKTTLFNCLSGFNLPTGGRISLHGRDITRATPSKRARLGLGRVFQNFGIFREMTVQENMLLALEATRAGSFFPWSAAHRRHQQEAFEYLDSVGLAEKAGDKAGSL
ncbi:MAG: ATP-binding cassette domain-containing protein, partial [Bdellovibrionales bacterium]|nr:ATP-binding cassette domain-containing protein [Bdellovibrionales bacterium]